MTVGLWKLSSLDGRRPPWYRPLIVGSTTCSNPGFAILQPSFSLVTQGKRQFLLYFSEHRSSEWHWTKQQWRAPRFFFPAVSNDMPALFTLCCCSAWCRFPVSACSHLLFHSKHRARLTGYSDWQAAWMWGFFPVTEDNATAHPRQFFFFFFLFVCLFVCLLVA